MVKNATQTWEVTNEQMSPENSKDANRWTRYMIYIAEELYTTNLDDWKGDCDEMFALGED